MKKLTIGILVSALICLSLLSLYSAAADTRYKFDMKLTLADFDGGSDATENIEAGGSQWGSRWADTTIGTAKGLDGTKNALSVKISEYSDGDGIILTGFECSLLGGSETYNDWTAGKYLIMRIKNNTSAPFRISPALDVNDGSDGRVRVWVNGAQRLLDDGYKEVATENVYALCSDGVSYGDRLCYTVIPGSFDGWLLIDKADYAMGVGDYECISNDSFEGIDWSQVMHLTSMVQFAGGADFTVDSVALADASVEAITEAPVTEAVQPDEDAPAPAEVTSPKTLDIAVSFVLLAIASTIALCGLKVSKRAK